MSGNKIDMALDDIIKTNKPARKSGNNKVGKGGAKRANKQQAGNNNQKQQQRKNGIKKAQANSPGKKPANNRAGLRPRTAPGKAKTTFARAKAPQQMKKTTLKKTPLNKSQSQKMAIQRLNKARETLQKAVKAVNAANKNLAKQMPQKKSAPVSRRNSVQNAAMAKRKQAVSRQQNNKRLSGGKVQKRQPVRRGDVAIKISNRGPSGRGKGRVNVVRDTLKKEKPATSLDDRFSQLLKSASRTANRSRGGAGRRVTAGGRGGRGRGGGGRGGNRRY